MGVADSSGVVDGVGAVLLGGGVLGVWDVVGVVVGVDPGSVVGVGPSDGCGLVGLGVGAGAAGVGIAAPASGTVRVKSTSPTRPRSSYRPAIGPGVLL